MEKEPLIIIGGATASGKTAISVKLARAIGAEIISADSMQVYKGMNIGTAKVRPEETYGVRHYMIDEVDAGCDFNIYEFRKRSDSYMAQIRQKGSIPIITGGTGFYIRSLLYDTDFCAENASLAYRKSLEALSATELYSMLLENDKEAARQIHPHNKKRIIRALEFSHNTGELISEHNEEQKKRSSPYNYAYFILNRDRSELYRRIEKRVDLMAEEGLEEEVRQLLSEGIASDAVSMQAIGYKEMVSYLNGEISYEQAIDLIKLNTRHYAKRQLTWFRREKDAIWINFEDYENEDEMTEAMIKILKEKEIV